MRRRTRWILAGATALAVVVGLGAGAVALYVDSLTRQFDENTTTIVDAFPDETLRPTPSPTPTTPAAPATAQNILLLGSDTRGSFDSLDSVEGRSDTMMVVNIPADRSAVTVMSVMRDSWVEIPGHGEAKINAAMAWGGIPLTVQTVESLITVRIDHVVIVDFESFGELTEALGGVDVYNEIPFSVAGYDFPVGAVHLDGANALHFVRERYSFPDADYQRVRNQQAFLQAALAKILSSTTLLDPGRVQALVGAVSPYLAVDPGFDGAYVGQLAFELRNLQFDDVRFFTAPTRGTSTSADGQSIVLVDWARLGTIQAAFAADDITSLPSTIFQ